MMAQAPARKCTSFAAASSIPRAVRAMISDFAAEMHPPANGLADAKLAVTEACTNAITHAYPDQTGVIDVTLDTHNACLRVAVRDYGIGFNPSLQHHEVGTGLPLIKALTTTLILDHCEPGTRITMTFAP